MVHFCCFSSERKSRFYRFPPKKFYNTNYCRSLSFFVCCCSFGKENHLGSKSWEGQDEEFREDNSNNYLCGSPGQVVLGGDYLQEVIGLNPSTIYWMVFFHIYLLWKNSNVCLKKTENKRKEAGDGWIILKCIGPRCNSFNEASTSYADYNKTVYYLFEICAKPGLF